MSRFLNRKFVGALAIAALILQAPSVFACAACFGTNVDSPLARGMNWGIFALLAVVVSVLAAVASFFIYLARRSAMMAAAAATGELAASTQKV
jgi:hypothetical protein